MKERIFEIVSSPDEPSKLSKAFDIFIICLIVLNVITVIADTFSLPEWARNILWWIEVVSVVIFTLEYLLRIYTADLMFPEMKPFRARLRYIRSFMAVIDLLAILPFYVPYIIPIDLRVLRMLRIIRLLRIFKINRYTTALSTIADVFKRKRHELLSSIAVVSMLIFVSASVTLPERSVSLTCITFPFVLLSTESAKLSAVTRFSSRLTESLLITAVAALLVQLPFISTETTPLSLSLAIDHSIEAIPEYVSTAATVIGTDVLYNFDCSFRATAFDYFEIL